MSQPVIGNFILEPHQDGYVRQELEGLESVDFYTYTKDGGIGGIISAHSEYNTLIVHGQGPIVAEQINPNTIIIAIKRT